ncbi:predicted protein [Plenodomus lingam JN3]|uniref:Predicted protein n=1 Tax=Leptosphaeria maculans (strain JN3 / isolate v23.1.3 / race Av1-4-5-6-7-8) TaxID=985895 RepID=E5AAD8_LEPMJ|nr:predicted protein [Plenodomus lingam JN3]CBY00629.1 predicted protein [Plenodomus lingam JN3]
MTIWPVTVHLATFMVDLVVLAFWFSRILQFVGQLAGQYWVAQSSGPGPRHEGIYLKAAKGRIDGRHVFNSCKKYGARESTCFSCEQPLENKDGSIQCFSPRS